MITIDEAKALAKELARSTTLTHSAVLESVAHAAGFRDWNTFSARAKGQEPDGASPDPVGRQRVVPVLRVFDLDLARQFYGEVLGFRPVWEHRFDDESPRYAEVERDGLVLHLSEHHGDATPGSRTMLVVEGLTAYREQVLERGQGHTRPGIEEEAWGRTMTVDDPCGNRLTFWERTPRA